MRAVLRVRHPAVPDLEHVGIVPVVRPRELREGLLPVEDGHNAVPAIGDIARGPPEMPEAARPFPWSIAAPFADGEHHRPPGRADRLGPRRVRGARVESARVAPVDLHEVDVPGGEAARVDELAPAAAGISLAGAVARAGVEAVAQLAGVQV